MHSFTFTATTALALLLPSARGFWRLECQGNSALARLDPLMAFDSIGDHVHSIKGGSAFSPTSKAEDLLNSKCTSCGVAQDMSAYWAPAMYFINDDGTAELVPEKPPHKSYYLMYSGLTHNGKKQTVEAFPNGFQMVAGNNFRRNTTIPDPDPNPLGPWPDSDQVDLAQRALGFNCLHYAAGNGEPTLRRHKLPEKSFMDANCVDGIRLEMQFPSCWNGELDGGALHKSHVAYPDGVSVGNCPQGYDRRLITLMFETIVATDQFKGKSGKFVMANGDPTGFGYHGDFIAAWKDDTLNKALKECNEQLSSGVMKDCPVFTMAKDSEKCEMEAPLPPSIAHEKPKGPIKGGLLNGLQIQNGPEPATPPGKSQSAPAPAPASNKPAAEEKKKQEPAPAMPQPLQQKKAQPADNAGVRVAQKNKEVAPAPLPATASPTTTLVKEPKLAITTAPPSPPELKAGEHIFKTSYSTQGNTVYEVVMVVKDVYVTKEVPRKRELHLHKHLRHARGEAA